jgi:hypothetical protein
MDISSVMKTVYWRVTDPEHRLVSQFSWAAGLYFPMLNKFFETFFQGDFPNKGKQVYQDHVDEVRSLVPPERLLEYRISDGWDPLCNFLDEEVPDTQFPTGNDMANFFKRCRTRNRRQMMNSALQAVTMGGAFFATGAAVFYAFKRLR